MRRFTTSKPCPACDNYKVVTYEYKDPCEIAWALGAQI